jgi:hypothetical protein
MKNLTCYRLFFLLISLSVFTSCKKLIVDKAPDSTLSDKLVGNYSMSEIITGGKTFNLPYKQGSDELNGVIEIVKTTEVEIEVNYTFNTIIKGVKETDNVTDFFYVKQGSNDIEIFEDEKFLKQIGSLAAGKTLYLVSGDTDRITALKN